MFAFVSNSDIGSFLAVYPGDFVAVLDAMRQTYTAGFAAEVAQGCVEEDCLYSTLLMLREIVHQLEKLKEPI
jgi:hypothetical protein